MNAVPLIVDVLIILTMSEICSEILLAFYFQGRLFHRMVASFADIACGEGEWDRHKQHLKRRLTEWHQCSRTTVVLQGRGGYPGSRDHWLFLYYTILGELGQTFVIPRIMHV